jgi:hypothetical protein
MYHSLFWSDSACIEEDNLVFLYIPLLPQACSGRLPLFGTKALCVDSVIDEAYIALVAKAARKLIGDKLAHGDLSIGALSKAVKICGVHCQVFHLSIDTFGTFGCRTAGSIFDHILYIDIAIVERVAVKMRDACLCPQEPQIVVVLPMHDIKGKPPC